MKGRQFTLNSMYLNYFRRCKVSPAADMHFSALAFLGTHNFDEFIKLILFNLFIMAEPLDRRSVRSRKPTVHFDDKIAQSLASVKPAKPAKPTKPTKPAQKSQNPPAP